MEIIMRHSLLCFMLISMCSSLIIANTSDNKSNNLSDIVLCEHIKRLQEELLPSFNKQIDTFQGAIHEICELQFEKYL